MAKLATSELCRELNGAGGCECECHDGDDDNDYSDAGDTEISIKAEAQEGGAGEGDEQEAGSSESKVEEDGEPTQMSRVEATDAEQVASLFVPDEQAESTNKTIAGEQASSGAAGKNNMWACCGATEEYACPCPCHKEEEEVEDEEVEDPEEGKSEDEDLALGSIPNPYVTLEVTITIEDLHTWRTG